MSQILSIDVGTSAVKAAVITRAGEVVCTASQEVRSAAPSEGRVEQSPYAWWEATKECIMSIEPEARGGLAAIVLTGQMQDVILVKGCKEIRPAILYSDWRAEAQSQTLKGKNSGQEDMFWASPSSVPAKLVWLQEHEPANFSASELILFGAHDFVCLQLCGVAACDYTTASTTGLLSDSGLDWSADALETLGLSRQQLPDLYPGSAKVGTIPAPLSETLRLPLDLPVFHGCGDAGATAVGSGCSNVGCGEGVFCYIGTSGWVSRSAATRVHCRGSMSIRSPEQDASFIHVAPCSTAGGNVEQVLVRCLHAHESREDALQASEDLALQSPAGAAGVIYMPYLNGERCPFTDPHARACFIGIHPNTTQADLHRAVLEGVAFSLSCLLEAVEGAALGSEGAPLRVAGGGTKSRVLMQALADISRRPIAVMHQGDMVAVRGAAILAGVGLRWFQPAAPLPASFFPVLAHFTPRPATQPVYCEMLQIFRGLHPALEASFARLAAVRESLSSVKCE